MHNKFWPRGVIGLGLLIAADTPDQAHGSADALLPCSIFVPKC